jgi:thymidylate kinase
MSTIRRRGRRSSFSVALVGCDGAGKTTVARKLEDETDLPVRYLYMGVSSDSSNRQLLTTRLAHKVKRARGAAPDTAGPREPVYRPASKGLKQKVRRGTRATLRLGNRLAEEWYRQLIAESHRIRGSIVLFDRHFVADYHAADMAAGERPLSRRIHGALLAKTYPKPDLVIYLDAPAEVLFARKGEGTLPGLERRRGEYLALADVTPSFHVVQATQPLEEVVAEVTGIIRAYGAARG